MARVIRIALIGIALIGIARHSHCIFRLYTPMHQNIGPKHSEFNS